MALKPWHFARSKSFRAAYWRNTGQRCLAIMTLENSQQPSLLPMELPSMSSAAGSHVKTSARRDMALALKANVVAYGLSTPDLLASYDRSSSSWRTSQRCLVEGWGEFSETWPRSGMMRNGTVFRLPPLVPTTDETAFDCGLPLRSVGTTTAKGQARRAATVWQRKSGNGRHQTLEITKRDVECTRPATIIPAAFSRYSGGSEFGEAWRTEPNVGRVAYGLPNGMDRIKGLGNAVVPQIPELIGYAIIDAIREAQQGEAA